MKKIVSILLVLLAIATRPRAADSYYALIPATNSLPLAWSYENATVASAFPGAYAGQKMHVWNIGSQSFDVITYRSAPFNSWSNGSYVLTNGLGFIWENNTATAFNLSVSGTNIATLAVTNSFSKTNWYLLADPFRRHTNTVVNLECVFDTDTWLADYTTNCFDSGIVLNWGDIVHTWENSAWRGGVRDGNPCDVSVEPYWQHQNNTNCVPAWTNKVSPPVAPGFAFWYYPATNTTWIVRTNLVSCNE